MLTIYNWRIKRSGACLRVLGIAVDSAGNIDANYKRSDIGAVQLSSAGDIVAMSRETGLAVAYLSAVKFENRHGHPVTFDEAYKIQQGK